MILKNKGEVEEEYQRDPLRLSNAVQSLDEPVTYEEFGIWYIWYIFILAFKDKQ